MLGHPNKEIFASTDQLSVINSNNGLDELRSEMSGVTIENLQVLEALARDEDPIEVEALGLLNYKSFDSPIEHAFVLLFGPDLAEIGYGLILPQHGEDDLLHRDLSLSDVNMVVLPEGLPHSVVAHSFQD